jgi:hypothetical protein
MLSKEFHLANSPWFILTRENVIDCLKFVIHNKKIYDIVVLGGLANESLFAIIFKYYNKLEQIVNEQTHITDWSRMTSPTSPFVFIDGEKRNIEFINNNLKKNKYSIFIRKVSPEFPDEVLREYIFIKKKFNFSQKILLLIVCIIFIIVYNFTPLLM